MTNIQLLHGDCLELMRDIPAGSVDAVITDPPYGINWDTNGQRYSGGNATSIARRGAGRNWNKPVANDDVPFDPSPWLNFPRVVLFGANHFAARLPVGTTLVWLKRNDAAFGSFLSDAEIAWMKGNHGVYCFKDLSMKGESTTRAHPTQKPVPLMKWVLDRAGVPMGATVLDPYMGAGSTGVACVQTGRNFIGMEIDPNYYAIAQQRIEAAQAQPSLFVEAA